MKNVYLIPTDKPSRLFKDNSQALNLHTHPVMKGIFTNGIGSNQNLYITSSNKEIKRDWFISLNDDESFMEIIKNNEVDDFSEYANEDWVKNCKKIILTDNKDLINDGVQAIDDEFLDWFVKNSSCEWVEVASFCKYGDDCPSKGAYLKQHLCDIGYKIIIPEESKLIN